ncbi:hypothetical protein HKX48_001270 [Thoreauomyces humboldtii]|nr:hypothetical protein HKX48_001270 [Thoreauomyces humboldtii]
MMGNRRTLATLLLLLLSPIATPHPTPLTPFHTTTLTLNALEDEAPFGRFAVKISRTDRLTDTTLSPQTFRSLGPTGPVSAARIQDLTIVFDVTPRGPSKDASAGYGHEDDDDHDDDEEEEGFHPRRMTLTTVYTTADVAIGVGKQGEDVTRQDLVSGFGKGLVGCKVRVEGEKSWEDGVTRLLISEVISEWEGGRMVRNVAQQLVEVWPGGKIVMKGDDGVGQVEGGYYLVGHSSANFAPSSPPPTLVRGRPSTFLNSRQILGIMLFVISMGFFAAAALSSRQQLQERPISKTCNKLRQHPSLMIRASVRLGKGEQEDLEGLPVYTAGGYGGVNTIKDEKQARK